MTQELSPVVLQEVDKTFTIGIFRKKQAVKNVSFEIPRGEILGLLGPNGSGKSTIIKMIMGFLRPTRGEILVNGHSPDNKHARRAIGYLPENPRFQRFMTGRSVLLYLGGLLQLERRELGRRVEELLELVGLQEAADERNQGYSKGMIQRLALAQALLAKPSVLILDEPMSGLDPLGRVAIRQIIARIHEESPSTTIFFSTHILHDAEQLCSSILLLRDGVLQRLCSLRELIASQQLQEYDVVFSDDKPEVVSLLKDSFSHQPTALGLQVRFHGENELIEQLSKMKKMGARVLNVTLHRGNLEETLFKKTLRDESQSQEGSATL